MSRDVGEQKLLIVSAVLDLNKKLNSLEYINHQVKQPENKVALKIFDDLFKFIHSLLWESIVINVCWLYEKVWKLDKHGNQIKKVETRSLYWYLEEQKKSFPNKNVEFNNKLSKIDSLETTVNKVRSIRDKWIAHRDRKAFENPTEYFKEVGLKFQDIETLIKTADEIIQEHFPVGDLTDGTGIHKLFWVIEYADLLPEKIEETKQKINFQEKIRGS